MLGRTFKQKQPVTFSRYICGLKVEINDCEKIIPYLVVIILYMCGYNV